MDDKLYSVIDQGSVDYAELGNHDKTLKQENIKDPCRRPEQA